MGHGFFGVSYKKDMKVTYIQHSSFLVETENMALLFDYYQGEVPSIDKNKKLLVFASHNHRDHFSKTVFRLGDQYPDLFYILSDDIKKRRVPEQWLAHTRFVGAGQSLEIEGVKIETLKSTDEGVAFWISCEGKEIYHAGDLNDWFWEGEDPVWNKEMGRSYRQEIKKLRGRHADVAFLVLDPRLGDWFYLGMDEFMKEADVEKIFPMHLWGDYSMVQKIKALDCTKAYRDKIVEVHREGEYFEWNN